MPQSAHDEKMLELKVGAMILAALVIFVVFILIISDFSFGKKTSLDVYFQNPGGLSPGVAVTIAGRKVGKITQITFMGQNGPINPRTNRPSLVKVKIEMNQESYLSLRNDVHFYITTQGILGDPFLEIDPGISLEPLNKAEKLFGTDPPRLDLFLADAAELIKSLNRLLITNADNLDQLVASSTNIVAMLDAFMSSDPKENKSAARFLRILENTETLTVEAGDLIKGLKSNYINNPDIRHSIKNVKSISEKLDKDLSPLLAEVRSTLDMVNKLGDTIGPKEQEAIKSALSKLDSIASKADRTLVRLDIVMQSIEAGEGTLGQLLKEEEIYLDLKELVRDLKRHPWKLIWQD